MKTFAYRGFDLTGQVSRGLIEAQDLKEARERLSSRGILAERVDPADQRVAARRFGRTRAFPLDARAVLYRELAALLRAGIPLAAALEVCLQTPERPDDAIILAGVRDRIRDGANMADALAAGSRALTPFEHAVIHAGERAGNLDAVLEQLADYLDEHLKLRESLASALIYPAIVIALAVGIGAVMLGVVIPSMSRLFQEGNMALPFLTRALLWTGQHLMPLALPILLILALVVVYLVYQLRHDPVRREAADQRLFRMPVIGHGYRLLAHVRFARTLGLLLRGGVPLVEGIELAGSATGSAWLRTLLKTEADAVRQGRTLAQALRNVPPLSGSLPGWIQAGEAGGNLDNLLDKAAARYQQQWTLYIGRVLTVLEPVLILLVGGFVLLIALAILMPILSLNQTLQ
jgi:general secretion pathway protein F